AHAAAQRRNGIPSLLEALGRLPRLRLATLPTPVQPMPRLGARLGGAQLWVKRDDLTGLGLGGNKVRKLELLTAEARAHGAETLVTMGAVQSNHCRQTAAAAAHLGLGCVLVLGGDPPVPTTGNVLLDQLLGAELVWAGGGDREAALAATFDRLWKEGRRPYRIPYGGSSPLGACGYALALAEFLDQGVDVDRIVFASSSGGTQAGLIAGAAATGFRGQITGISIDLPAADLVARIGQLIQGMASLLGHDIEPPADSIQVADGYRGAGYAILGQMERDAIREFARSEGLILDPVYTGRAAAGLLDLIRSGHLGKSERILFWHTGGEPALFAYAGELT
ncbi:MAG: D-cysteine desulfhydrase family protein, partial [Anaerolineales bacterium]